MFRGLGGLRGGRILTRTAIQPRTTDAAASCPDALDIPSPINNPFWSEVRNLPGDDLDWKWRREWRPLTYSTNQGHRDVRREMVRRYAWSIPSPGDVAWMAARLDGRPLLEVGAGTGYWSYLLAQSGVDVVATDSRPVPQVKTEADATRILHRPRVINPFHGTGESWTRVRRFGAVAAVRRFPGRVLFLSWPPYEASMAHDAVRAFTGDALFYAGEDNGGCTGNDAFFDLLDTEWDCVAASPHHVTWSGINDRLTYWWRRK